MTNPPTNRRLSPKTTLLATLSAVCLVRPLGALRLPCQNIRAKFSGTIRDPGAPVPNATIMRSREKPNAFETTSSNREGNFSFTTLSAGECQMRVLKPEFEDYCAPRVVLQPANPRREDHPKLGRGYGGNGCCGRGNAKVSARGASWWRDASRKTHYQNTARVSGGTKSCWHWAPC
jgi:hypothetical protein